MSKLFVKKTNNNIISIKKFKKLSLFVFFIFIYAVFITGGTYAYLSLSAVASSAISGSAGCGVINYNGTNVLNEDIQTSENYTGGVHSVITMYKSSNSGYGEATIYLHNNTSSVLPFASSNSASNAFKYIVLDGSTTISSGVVTKGSEDQVLAIIPLSTTSKNYDVYLWVDSSLSNGAYNGTSYSGYLYATADCDNTLSENKLYNIVRTGAVLDNTSSTYVSSSSGIDFTSKNSDTNGKGVYIRAGTQNDTYPIYYYRGNIDNNNVIFANMCFKIVRTTDTGGIKMIYNGVPTNGTCNNTGTATQIGTKAFNSNYTSVADVGYMYGTRYAYSSKSSSDLATAYVYGKSFTYSGGSYTLTNTLTSTGTWSSDYNTLNNAHYTCFNTTGTCTSIYYIFYTITSNAYYITLTGGKSVSDALSDMLDHNTTSSTIEGNSTTEGTIDYWYYNNIDQVNDSKGNSYSTYIEDTIYCNDRSYNNYSASGWNPDGGSTSTYLYFASYGRNSNPIVTCPRDIDKFSVSSSKGNGSLDYPVGLLTEDEIRMAGVSGSNNYNYYLYNGPRGSSGGTYWWSASPCYLYVGEAFEWFVSSYGRLGNYYVYGTYGVRPVVSLRAGIKISGGDGTSDSPYLIKE